MTRFRSSTLLLCCSMSVGACVYGQQQATPGARNAALRYWSAFSVMQDASITGQKARELRAVVEDGAAYSDSQFGELVKGNVLALRVMSRGTELPICNWGLDYGLAENLPVEYATKALVLGRLNVLYADHLFATGDFDGGVHALAVGLRFSRDVGAGGPLISTLIAKGLLLAHLNAVAHATRGNHLSARQRVELREAVDQIKDGLDWSGSAMVDLQALRAHFGGDAAAQAAITKIIPIYSEAITSPYSMNKLPQALANLPQQVQQGIPNADRLSEQRHELAKRIVEVRALLQ